MFDARAAELAEHDVLSVQGEPMTSRPYARRRVVVLEDLHLDGPQWRTPQAFDDGEALWAAVCEHELEGVVTKKRSSRYVSGERGWIKTKNRDYWLLGARTRGRVQDPARAAVRLNL